MEMAKEELKKLMEDATPLPWVFRPVDLKQPKSRQEIKTTDPHVIQGWYITRDTYPSDAAFIVGAVNAIPELLEEIDKLEKACRSALEHLDNADMSYANGNTHNGIDEGDVLGGRAHCAVTKELRAALGE